MGDEHVESAFLACQALLHIRRGPARLRMCLLQANKLSNP